MRQIIYLVLVVAGCTNQTTMVYESRGDRQCEGGGSTLSESRSKLAEAGVDVLGSDCGMRTGVAFIAVCGGPTGQILLHEIKARDYEKASELGFAKTDNLVDGDRGIDYEVIPCPGG